MWTAETVLVCALALRTVDGFRPIVLLDTRPLGISGNAVGPVRSSERRIYLTLAMSVAIVEAVDESLTLPRVRSESRVLTNAITEGSERSPTFRGLVEKINSSDGLVYVEEGICRFSVRSCFILLVRIAGPYRLLRILVDARKGKGCDLVGSIGHELQHAIELLSNPQIRSDAQAFHFFQRIGPTGSERFETRAADRTGMIVARECLETTRRSTDR